jgi:hypothetical protein
MNRQAILYVGRSTQDFQESTQFIHNFEGRIMVEREQGISMGATPHLVMLSDGGVLFKHWLSPQEQQKLVKEVHCLVRPCLLLRH